MKNEEWRSAVKSLISDCTLSDEIWDEILTALECADNDLPLFNEVAEKFMECGYDDD